MGGFDAATLREVSGVVAMLGSRKVAEVAVGLNTLVRICNTKGDSNQALQIPDGGG
jgi:hypothetical protein